MTYEGACVVNVCVVVGSGVDDTADEAGADEEGLAEMIAEAEDEGVAETTELDCVAETTDEETANEVEAASDEEAELPLEAGTVDEPVAETTELDTDDTTDDDEEGRYVLLPNPEIGTEPVEYLVKKPLEPTELDETAGTEEEPMGPTVVALALERVLEIVLVFEVG